MEIKEPPKLQQQNSDFLSIDQYFEEFDPRLVLSYLNFNFQLHLTDAARQIIFYLKINITHVQFVIDNNSKFFKIILHYPTLTTHSTSSLYISLSFFIHLEVLTHIKTLAPLPSPTKKKKRKETTFLIDIFEKEINSVCMRSEEEEIEREKC